MDFERLNSATKYPSIFTHHELGVGPYLMPEVQAAYKRMLSIVQSGPYAHCHQPFKAAKREYFRLMAEHYPAETPVQTLVWNNGNTCLSIRPEPGDTFENPFDDEALEAPEKPSLPWERYETLREAVERYNELREALAASLERGDDLMKTRATERLVEWCYRHHNPREGWFFPRPGEPDFVPWGKEGPDWTEAFGSFQ